ncbi:hypothetical protein ACS0TY_028765 [Phlomoides rotata]
MHELDLSKTSIEFLAILVDELHAALDRSYITIAHIRAWLFRIVILDNTLPKLCFGLRRNAAGQLGLSTLQKVTTDVRILAYDVPADATDEYIKIGESTTIDCLKRFCRSIVEIFGEQ